MRELFILTKASLVNNFSLHSLNPKHLNNKKEAAKLGLFVVLVVALLPVYLLYTRFIRQMGMSLLMINQTSYFMALAHYGATLLMFILGLTYVLSYYYFSRDTDMLLPLPVKGRNIVVSKFIALLFYQYIFTGLFLAPIIVVNASLVGSSFVYYLKSFLIFLALPIIPLSIASMVIILIMRFTNFGGKKDLIRAVSMILFMVFFLGLQVLVQRSMLGITPGEEEAFLAELFMNNRALLDGLVRWLPFSGWASLSLYLQDASSWLYLLGVLGTSLVAFIAMIVFSEKMYLGGIIGGHEIQSKKKAMSEAAFDKASGKVSKSFMAIFKVDLITLIKTPIYMFNCVSIVVIIPFVFLVMPMLTGLSSEMEMIIDLYYANIDLFTLGLAGGYVAFAALNPTAPTTFSREGNTFYITRIIPVSTKDQIIGRSLSPLLLQLITILLVSVGFGFYLPVGIGRLLLSAVLGLLGSVPLILIGLLVDINRPLLNWDNPQRAVKQNMNVIFSMLIGGGIVVGLGALTFMLIRLGIGLAIQVPLLVIICLVISVIVFRLLSARMAYQLQNME